MNDLNPVVLETAISLDRAGKGRQLDRLLSRATRHHRRAFRRLAHFKAYADAVLAARPVQLDALVCPHCEAGPFEKDRGLAIHVGLWCKDAPSRRVFTPRQIEAVTRYATTTDNAQQIAADFKVSTASLYKWLAAARVPLRQRKRGAA